MLKRYTHLDPAIAFAGLKRPYSPILRLRLITLIAHGISEFERKSYFAHTLEISVNSGDI